METQSTHGERLEELRRIVAEVLEREPEEISDLGDFRKDYEADSMRAIEILSRLEKKYHVDLPQSVLPDMKNLSAVYAIVAVRAGWKDETCTAS